MQCCLHWWVLFSSGMRFCQCFCPLFFLRAPYIESCGWKWFFCLIDGSHLIRHLSFSTGAQWCLWHSGHRPYTTSHCHPVVSHKNYTFELRWWSDENEKRASECTERLLKLHSSEYCYHLFVIDVLLRNFRQSPYDDVFLFIQSSMWNSRWLTLRLYHNNKFPLNPCCNKEMT